MERKYALRRVGKGDYLLLSNDDGTVAVLHHYLWSDLIEQLPREIIDRIDPRDYDTAGEWWDAYIAAIPHDAEYGSGWLLSVTPTVTAP